MAEWTITLNDKVIKRFTINEGQKVSIGRGSEADVVVDNTAISRLHTSLERVGGIYLISDLGSLNGTFVNDVKVKTDMPIAKTDDIKIGKFRLAPATDNARELSSSSVAALDMDDETVFVGSHAKSATEESPKLTPRVKKKGGRRLTVISGEATPAKVSLEGRSSIKIGKDPSCDLVIPGWLVAKAQCYLISRDGKYFLLPQRSWAGTFVNGDKIKAERELRPEDIIEIRQARILFD